MRQINFRLALLVMAAVAACGGGSGNIGGGDGAGTSKPPGSDTGAGTPKPGFAGQVTFGDSLSDVGSYAVGGIQVARGGKYTINGDNTAVNPALT
jgi:hypothetical protein